MGNSPPVFRPFHKKRAQNRPEIRLSSQNKYMEDLTMKQLQHGSLFLLAALLLTLPVFADSGPKPMIYVWVENGPEEPYYMDLLEEDPYTPIPLARTRASGATVRRTPPPWTGL